MPRTELCARCDRLNLICDCGAGCQNYCIYCGVLFRPPPPDALDIQIEMATNEEWRTR